MSQIVCGTNHGDGILNYVQDTVAFNGTSNECPGHPPPHHPDITP